MNLKYITCSDPRESLQINDLIELTKISPKVEIGMQSHPSAMMSGLDRNIWFNQFLDWAGKQKNKINPVFTGFLIENMNLFLYLKTT